MESWPPWDSWNSQGGVSGCMQLHGPAKSLQLAKMSFENKLTRRAIKQLCEEMARLNNSIRRGSRATVAPVRETFWLIRHIRHFCSLCHQSYFSGILEEVSSTDCQAEKRHEEKGFESWSHLPRQPSFVFWALWGVAVYAKVWTLPCLRLVRSSPLMEKDKVEKFSFKLLRMETTTSMLEGSELVDVISIVRTSVETEMEEIQTRQNMRLDELDATVGVNLQHDESWTSMNPIGSKYLEQSEHMSTN